MSGTYINSKRLTEEFVELISIDSLSFREAQMAERLKEKLRTIGLTVEEDNAASSLDKDGDGKSASNIYVRLPGNIPGPARLFCSHMDTVAPGTGKRAVIGPEGTITSAKDTVLGADDVSGLVSILEALRAIKENDLPHPDLEILFTAAEEPYCKGSRYVDYDRLHSREGYVLDLTGPVGTAAAAAPSIISLTVTVTGRAAHAGFAPEKGINALSIAAVALAGIRTGRVDEDLTVNFGTITGGNGKNIVPEKIVIEGEIRCLDHERALCEAERIREEFAHAAARYGGSTEVSVEENIRAYRVREDRGVVKRLIKASGELGFTSEIIVTYGGSDANRLNEHGIETIVAACAMENCHSTQEYTTVDELTRSAQLTLRLMTERE